MADIPDYTRQPRPLQVSGAISSHDLVIDDLFGWKYPEMTLQAQMLLEERKNYGLGKYVDDDGNGIPLHKDNGRNHIQDCLDETLDLVVYLRTALDAMPQLRQLLMPFYIDVTNILVSLANWQFNQREPASAHRPLPGSMGKVWTAFFLHPANDPTSSTPEAGT